MDSRFVRITIVVLVLAFALAPAVQAESNLHPIGKIGLNLANESTDTEEGEETNFRPGAHIGAGAELAVNEMIDVGAMAVLNMKGADYKWDQGLNEGEGASKLVYLSFPVTGRLSFSASNMRPYVKAGPEVGILLSAKHTSKGTHNGEPYDVEGDVKDYMKSTEIAFDLAGGVEMPVGGMTGIAELGFSLGLTDIEKDSSDKQEDSSTKTRTIFLSLGIRL